MRRTIIDLYYKNEGNIQHYMTFADFPKRGAYVSTIREGAISLALDEIATMLSEYGIEWVRLFDTYTLEYIDFER